MVQGDFPISLFHGQASDRVIVDKYIELTRMLPLNQLDLVVWPESMLSEALLSDDLSGIDWQIAREKAAHDPYTKDMIDFRETDVPELAKLLHDANVQLLAGAPTRRFDPTELEAPANLYNSAVLAYGGDNGQLLFSPTVYDKMHCVPASEYVPFGDSWPALHRLLRRLIPESMPQLTPGKQVRRFQIGHGENRWMIATPICYEGVFPQVCQKLAFAGVSTPPADALVNISNDGWFIAQLPGRQWASTELDQHMSQYVFRAIENRRPVVRAVNTGISGFVDSSGSIVKLVQHPQTGLSKMISGTAYMQVLVDQRTAPYSLIGDLPAYVCVAALVVTALLLWRPRPSGKKE